MVYILLVIIAMTGIFLFYNFFHYFKDVTIANTNKMNKRRIYFITGFLVLELTLLALINLLHLYNK
jgi:hypothetical protein